MSQKEVARKRYSSSSDAADSEVGISPAKQSMKSTAINGVAASLQKSHHTQLTLEFLEETRDIGTHVELDGTHLSIPQVYSVIHSLAVKVSASRSCLKEVEHNAKYLEEKINSGLVIYGINTGFGGSADVRSNQTQGMQQALVRHLNAGFGEVFEGSVVRGVMMMRANSLCRAQSGVRPDVINQLCDMLNADIIPVVPKRGSVSASGDLMPTSYIAAAMMGQDNCKVYHQGQYKSASQALSDSGIQPIIFQSKEALAVVNSCSFSSALGADILHAANKAFLLTQLCVAMSVESLSGHAESFHPIIHHAMPHPGQIEVAQNVTNFLIGSKLAIMEFEVDLPDRDGALKQDRYALRTAAQWLGPVAETLISACKRITTDLNSTNDNPIIDHSRNHILHGGNFQGTAIAVAMDQTRQALQLCGKLLFAQMSEIINVNYNNGLPPNLNGSDTSLDFGFKGTDTAMAAYMSELDLLTSPVTRHVLSAEMHNQAVNSLALISARWSKQALCVLHQMLANITLCHVQAIDLRWLRRQVLQELDKVCQNHDVNRTLLYPQVWPWYEFAFSATATASRFVETVPNVLNKSAFVNECTAIGHLVAKMRSKMCEEDVKKSLGEGTSKMYTFIRQTLNIPFYHGDRCLDNDLQKILDAILNGQIDSVLLDVFV